MNGFGRQGWWNPWPRLRQMQREMSRLFGEFAGPRDAAFPPVNVYTDDEGAVVTAELPGVDPKDLELTVHDHTLTVGGERKPDEGGQDDTWHRRERVFGRFVRTVGLPFAADPERVEATCRDGVLEIRLCRTEADKPRKIAVHS